MKKLIVPALLLGLFTVGCGGKKEQKTEDSETKQAIEKIEAEAKKIEAEAIKIEESAEKLDDLLNDLE
ncbi:hypothetical protein [Plebeiibacterium marinum]|uniref:Lipoprotein n=1 Tax=Plebeiibacterium marinum TaxID=2992111 RepID=A0AAE3MB85_9BACT|nr:hypothetical protein [Plebeiobacterium marinum]MCW3804256.1 hypothetical protein [Plebeiobacterium marinum]